MLKRVWIRVPAKGKDVLTTALERGFTTFVADPAEAESLNKLGKFRLLTLDGNEIREDGKVLGPDVAIDTVEDQEKALALAGKAAVVLVEARDWKIIPFENLIAAYQGKTLLVAPAGDAEEAKLLLNTLEVGVDAVLVSPRDAKDVIHLSQALEDEADGRLDLATAKVTRVKPLGSGDRVCLDACSLLKVGEGMLVGSSAQSLFLVHSESLESGYVAARPFRVNAGPVHAYTLLPGGKTKYLSELQAGDEVLAVDSQGKTRSVVLGRVKIETRPLLLIEAEADGKKFSTVVQNAETIRMVTPSGPKSVVHLEAGDELLLRLEEGGRHFGTHVMETITER